MVQSERWYWLPIFLILSVGINVGVVLLFRGAGGSDAAAPGKEIEVTLTPANDNGASRLLDPVGIPTVQPKPRVVAAPQPFSPPSWQKRPTRLLAVRQPEATELVVPRTQAMAPTGTGAAQGATNSGTTGSGQNGIMGVNPLPYRVFHVRANETPITQIPIQPAEQAGSDMSRSGVAGGAVSDNRNVLISRAKPQYRLNSPPVYPEEARAQRQQGTVYLRVAVTAEGRAESVDLLVSSGATLLDEAAISAVREWSFEPARTGEGPVSSRITVPVRFSLD